MGGFSSASFAVAAFSVAAFAFDVGYVDRTYPLAGVDQALPVAADQVMPITALQDYVLQGQGVDYPAPPIVFSFPPVEYPLVSTLPPLLAEQDYPLAGNAQRYPI